MARVAVRHRSETLRGSRAALPARRRIECGELAATLDGADLRDVRFRGVDIVRRIYAAARDEEWGTIAASDLKIDTASARGSTTIHWSAAFDEGSTRFDANGEYAVGSDGSVSASFRATAREASRYNRLGLCLLLPPAEFAGRPVLVDGQLEQLLPSDIGPQWIVDGMPTPLFPAFTKLELRGRSGTTLRVEFEGDLFEIEDQRNWTDDSYKIYSTPLALGYPHTAQAGQTVVQQLVLSVSAPSSPRRRAPAAGAVHVRIGRGTGRRLPPIGLGAPTYDAEGEAPAAGLLAQVQAAHLRVPIPPDRDAASAALAAGAGWANRMRTRLQLALEVDANGEAGLDPRQLDAHADHVRDVIVLAQGREATGAEQVGTVRARFGSVLSAARFHGGTDLSFCELNRASLDATGLDGVSYSVNPQVHAFDDASLFETLAGQAETVGCVRRLFPGLRVLVGPVTLRPRSGLSEQPGGLRLPAAVDTRQLSLLGAAWTLGSVHALSRAGADAITYYEPIGWCGLVERSAGPPRPDLFPSGPGEVFPLYHVLADANEAAGELLEVECSEPLAADVLAVADRDRITLLVANFQPEPTDVEIARLPSLRRIRRLDEVSAHVAATDPVAFRGRWHELPSSSDGVRLRLEPYETARLEAA